MKKISVTTISLLTAFFSVAQLSDANKVQLQKEIHTKVNDLRKSLGLRTLKLNDTLKEAASVHSKFQALNNKMTHSETKKELRDPVDRVKYFKGFDFELVGENVQEIPLPKGKLSAKEITRLSELIYQGWKNSPPHYKNMVDPAYEFENLAFSENKALTKFYATQVFGKKGTIIPGQMSTNAFGLKEAAASCEDEFKNFKNLVYNMGDNLQIDDGIVYFYYHDLSVFNKVFTKKDDGMAVDLVSLSQFPCKKQNVLDMSPVYDGVLLKPVFRDEMLKNNEAESSYRLITPLGKIPENLENKQLSLSMVLIKGGRKCMYLYPLEVPTGTYSLFPYTPSLVDTFRVEFVMKGIVKSQELVYDFRTNVKDPVSWPVIKKINYPVHSVKIRSYSSVEGDSLKNVDLHNSRAATIRKDLAKRLNISEASFTVDARENWGKMAFQFKLFELDSINTLDYAGKRQIVNQREYFLPWDSLLFSQRKATATIFYTTALSGSKDTLLLSVLNLHTAISKKNSLLINKSLKHLYFQSQESRLVILEDEVYELLLKEKSYVENAAAVFSKVYRQDVYKATEFLKTWVDRKTELSKPAINNLLYLYALLGEYFLDNWDISNERLSNVIHPKIMVELLHDKIPDELMINLHLTFIGYYGQINDKTNISKSFNFISDYIKKQKLTVKEMTGLALFYNYWSMNQMAVDLLYPEFEKKTLDEKAIFILAQTILQSDYSDEKTEEVILKALELNKERWCKWIKNDFQIMRYESIKSKYCEICK
ncbi:MAG: CAP domain-containing protein [Bacteroidota bacterium]